MPRLLHPRPMKDFDAAKPALVQEQLNEAVYEWFGVSPAEWDRGASWADRDRTVLNWDGLLIDGWQPIDDTTPRDPLPP